MRFEYIGLGDIIAAIAERMGIKQSAGCGCKYRQALLNKLFPLCCS